MNGSENSAYPIGVAGQPWGEHERQQWRSTRPRQRSYVDEIVAAIDALSGRFERIRYGDLRYASDEYPLFALRSRVFEPALPTALITGGVHGYETSGVLGALSFLDRAAGAYADRINLLVAPCVSPWAYERVDRWNFDAIDPNRNFREGGPGEAVLLIELVRATAGDYLVHLDLHETTDTDRTRFGPALSARDGQPHIDGAIPDGFYLVADSLDPQLAFQEAIVAAVERVTHIAEADPDDQIIGSPILARGVIGYPLSELGLCASISNARFKTTTEVYPDNPRMTPATCIDAQVAAVRAALDFALSQS